VTDPTPKKVVASKRWKDNAALIADVASLHFRPRDVVMDVTYGGGKFWTRYTPHRLIAHGPDGVDFRDLPEPARSVDVVVFDPPYVVIGGEDTSTIDREFHDRYGMRGLGTKDPAVLHRTLIVPGLRECIRVSRRLVLVKCMAYTSGGKLWLGPVRVVEEAERLGCRVVDWYDPLKSPARGPKVSPTTGLPRKQRRAVRTSSTLIVLRVPR
jgi:hypothetical protein